MRDRKRSGRARVAAAAVIAAMSALLLLAAPAFAASSAQQGYSTPGEKIQTTFDPHHTSLPFTSQLLMKRWSLLHVNPVVFRL